MFLIQIKEATFFKFDSNLILIVTFQVLLYIQKFLLNFKFLNTFSLSESFTTTR